MITRSELLKALPPNLCELVAEEDLITHMKYTFMYNAMDFQLVIPKIVDGVIEVNGVPRIPMMHMKGGKLKKPNEIIIHIIEKNRYKAFGNAMKEGRVMSEFIQTSIDSYINQQPIPEDNELDIESTKLRVQILDKVKLSPSGKLESLVEAIGKYDCLDYYDTPQGTKIGQVSRLKLPGKEFSMPLAKIPLIEYMDPQRYVMMASMMRHSVKPVQNELPIVYCSPEYPEPYGVNVNCLWMKMNILNFEDAIAVSRSFAEKFRTHTNRRIRCVNVEEVKVDIGSVVEPGECIAECKFNNVFYDGKLPADVVQIESREVAILGEIYEEISVFVKNTYDVVEGDKFTNRYAMKGVVSKIIEDEDMPYINDLQTHAEVVVNPRGIFSRKNPAQVMEALICNVLESDQRIEVGQFEAEEQLGLSKIGDILEAGGFNPDGTMSISYKDKEVRAIAGKTFWLRQNKHAIDMLSGTLKQGSNIHGFESSGARYGYSELLSLEANGAMAIVDHILEKTRGAGHFKSYLEMLNIANDDNTSDGKIPIEEPTDGEIFDEQQDLH